MAKRILMLIDESQRQQMAIQRATCQNRESGSDRNLPRAWMRLTWRCWCFQVASMIRSLPRLCENSLDTTGFSRVVHQLQPNESQTLSVMVSVIIFPQSTSV